LIVEFGNDRITALINYKLGKRKEGKGKGERGKGKEEI